MFFSFSPTKILYISSRVLLYVFSFNFSFCVNNGLEKKISFACAFVVILLFFWTHPSGCFWLPRYSFHYFGHFSKKTNDFNINLPLFPMAKILANLRQFVNMIRRNTMIGTPDKIWVITCWVKERKKRKKLINTNAIARHNAIAVSRDQQSWRSSFSLI